MRVVIRWNSAYWKGLRWPSFKWWKDNPPRLPMPDPVRVSVSEVRREIYRASGFAAGDGAPSAEKLGTLFHRVFQTLMEPNSRTSQNVLATDDSPPGLFN